MHKFIIIESAPIYKNKIHTALDIVVAPDFMRLYIAFVGSALDIIRRSIQNVDASAIRTPTLAIRSPELLIGRQDSLPVGIVKFVIRGRDLRIPVAPELGEELALWFRSAQ